MTGKNPKVKVLPNGEKEYGPYKGSAQNGGRPVTVTTKKTASGKRVATTENSARKLYEDKTGKKLPKGIDVDHKDNKGRAGTNDKMSNLDPLTHAQNVAKENKVRAGKKKK
jgi:hypothetical protein